MTLTADKRLVAFWSKTSGRALIQNVNFPVPNDSTFVRAPVKRFSSPGLAFHAFFIKSQKPDDLNSASVS